MEGVISMSKKEVDRIKIMEDLTAKRIKQAQAAAKLGLSVRQVIRLAAAYKAYGAGGLVHKSRGQPSNRAIGQKEKDQIVSIITEQYQDFGPTFACEKLNEVHGIVCSDETIRQLLIANGLWHAKRRKDQVIHPPRERRACRGELVQLDGSPHAWFEDRADTCVLVAFIDDATSQIMDGLFVDYEGTFPLFAATAHYLNTHGKPQALYVDRHSTYKVNRQATVDEELKDSQAKSQFGRAMDELAIAVIYARSPQAKGRVERLFETLQDRLVKELRLANIADKAQATRFFREIYIPKHNAKFAVVAKDLANAHQPLVPTDDLATIFTMQTNRVVSKDLVVSYKNTHYLLQATKGLQYTLKKARVTVFEDVLAKVSIHYKGAIVPYQVRQRQPKVSQPVQVLSGKEVAQRPIHIPKPDHPWRKGFTQPL